MRCPKCGYISFDHLETCNKCSKDLAGVSEKLDGGLVQAEAPQFLVVTPPSEDSFEADFPQGDGDEEFFDEEFSDDDLDVLLDDEAEDDDGPVISLADDDEDEEGGIDFDFSYDSDDDSEEDSDEEMFVAGEVDEDDEEADSPVVDDEFTLSVPTELSDMSDLSQEQGEEEEVSLGIAPEEKDEQASAPVADDDMSGFDLEELNLELDSVLSESAVGGGKEDFELSLNDIEFSELGQTGGAPALNPDGSVDMDADLDFELDLGGLSLHKKEEKV